MTDPMTALRSVPAPTLDPAPVHAAIDDLVAARRRRRRLPALALALSTVTAAAAALVLTTGGTPTATQPQVATAATVLRDLGRRAADAPPLRLAAGEYYAVRVHQYKAAGKDLGLDTRTWSHGDEGRELILRDGETTRDVPLGTPMPGVPNGADGPPDLGAFPTEPRALAQAMRAAAIKIKLDPDGEPSARDYMLTAMSMVFGQQRTPPEVLRGIYDFLAALPGMRLIGDVKDPLGRPGKAVAVDGDANHEGVGIELIVDPDSGLPLATVHYRHGNVDDPWINTTREEGIVNGTNTLPAAR